MEAFQSGNDEFEPADPVVRTFTVPKTPQTIFWEQELEGFYYGDTAILDAAASSSLPVRYSVKEGNAKIDGNQITFTSAGRIVIEAIQNGDLTYAQADPLERTFQIRPATLLAWPQEANRPVGKENPRFKILYDGFLFGDDENLLDRIPRAETPATLDSELGEYPVNLHGGLSQNYSFKYLEGILHVVEPGKKSQWIYFDQNLDGYRPDDFLRLEARTSSGLDVTFKIIEGRHLIDLPEPGALNFLETGTIMVRATQIGNSEYYPAPSVNRTFSIQGFDQEIYWDQDFSDVTYGDTLELNALATSGLQIEYSLLQGDASLAGNQLTLLSASQDVLIQARQLGNSRFSPADNVLRNFRVSKAPLQVFAKDVSLKANATKMPKLSFSYDGLRMSDKKGSIEIPPEISTTASLDSLPGQYPILLSGGSASNYYFEFHHGTLTRLAEGKRTQKINFKQDFSEARPSDIIELNATATSKLPVIYELIDGDTVAKLDGSTLQILTAGLITLRVHQPGNEIYNPASLVRIIDIDKFTQEISWRQSFAGVAYGDVITLAAEASSGLEIVYQITDGDGIIVGNQLTVTRPGTITVVATQSGDALYESAAKLEQKFAVGKAVLRCIADGKSGRAGQPIPELSISYNGLMLGDDESVIDVPPLPFTAATSDSLAGTYTIQLHPGYSELYDMQYQDGFLILEDTDNPPQSILWDQVFDGIVYGDRVRLKGSNETVVGNVRYIVLNNGLAKIDDSDGYLSLEVQGVGEIQVAALAEPTNEYNSAPPLVRTIRVGKRPLKAIAQSASRLPGTTNPAFRITYENLAGVGQSSPN